MERRDFPGVLMGESIALLLVRWVLVPMDQQVSTLQIRPRSPVRHFSSASARNPLWQSGFGLERGPLECLTGRATAL